MWRTAKEEVNIYYEFYGCSQYPNCKQKSQINEAHEYDGKTYERPERTTEEEAEDLRYQPLREGFSWGNAEYARHKWEKGN